MKKLIFLILLISSVAFAGFQVDGVTDPAKVDGVTEPAGVDGVASSYGEANQEVGYTGVTLEAFGNTVRCSKHTSGAAFTVNYGYYYTYDYTADDSRWLWLSVFEDNAGVPSVTQIGGCSDLVYVTNDTYHWKEVPWSSGNPSIGAAQTFWICMIPGGNIGTAYVTGSANDEYYEAYSGDCPTGAPYNTSSSTRNTALTVSNYQAH